MKKTAHGIHILFCLCVCMLLVACDSNTNIIPFLSSDVKSEEFYQHMLEQFCQEHYDNLYKDFWGKRKYQAGSLRIDSVRPIGEREVNVYGKHDFNGRIIGLKHPNREFKANILETKNNSHEYIITFEKESKKIISGKPYREARTKKFYYEE